MLFNSTEFLLFFPLVTAVYFLLPHRLRVLWLLAASCWFYMAFIPIYILILVFTIVIDYIAGIVIDGSQGAKRKTFLVVSLVANIGVLAVFKYFNFVNANLAALLSMFGTSWPVSAIRIVLPIGLSFHTFQAMSYTIEVYRGKQSAEKNFLVYALYVLFYPQLVAGPIERPQNLLHQFRDRHEFSYENARDGFRLMLWGMFKKVVIADRLALIVDRVYGDPTKHHGPVLLIATIFFAFQIYADFSGYSDIAIGAARVMGFKLMTNFNHPYLARSVAEFWKRWHISLSTWFRDYLYISLGGNRRGPVRWRFNLLVTFLLSGLWHGANWTFVIWGALNGLFLVAALATNGLRERWSRAFAHDRLRTVSHAGATIWTFCLVTFAWIFFRARSVSEALYIVKHLFSDYSGAAAAVRVFFAVRSELVLAMASIAVLLIVDFAQEHGQGVEFLQRRPTWQRWAFYYATAASILLLGKFGLQQFIYFQF